MKTLLNKIRNFRYNDLVLSGIYLLIGMAVLCFPSTAITVISVISGILLSLYSVCRMIIQFRDRKHPYALVLFLLNLFTLFVGILLIFRASEVFAFIGFITGLYLVFDAVAKLFRLFSLRGAYTWRFWVSLILPSLTLLLGLSLLFMPSNAMNLTALFLGISLIAEGVQSAVLSFTLKKQASQTNENHAETYIETDFVDKSDE